MPRWKESQEHLSLQNDFFLLRAFTGLLLRPLESESFSTAMEFPGMNLNHDGHEEEYQSASRAAASRDVHRQNPAVFVLPSRGCTRGSACPGWAGLRKDSPACSERTPELLKPVLTQPESPPQVYMTELLSTARM